ncbi:hypothetical protein ABEG17_05280 [Pedococcus sp. KACC 23699]|uniref:Uncharacterized protein n=1 Tax=Pedococcus sp. KACC 23699 TaxID=3149228 RepID=A0AAU7JWE4_9MICO
MRNTLAALRGYLELAHETARGRAGRPEDVVRDLDDALLCLAKLERRLGVHVDDGTTHHETTDHETADRGDPPSERPGVITP